MKKIEATIPSSTLDEVKHRLFEVGARGLTMSEVRKFLRPDGAPEANGHLVEVTSVTKVNVQIVVDDEMVHPIVEAILAVGRRDSSDEGQIYISTINEVIRIRTGERGFEAL